MSPSKVLVVRHSRVRSSGKEAPACLSSGLLVVRGGLDDAGGKFKLELFLPGEYPMTPPKVRFLTKIYHPNIGMRRSFVLPCSYTY